MPIYDDHFCVVFRPDILTGRKTKIPSCNHAVKWFENITFYTEDAFIFYNFQHLNLIKRNCLKILLHVSFENLVKCNNSGKKTGMKRT
jgi:hypothetical protein